MVGSSSLTVSNVGGSPPLGAAAKAVAREEASYRVQPPSVIYKSFAFELISGFHSIAVALISRLQGAVNLVALSFDDCTTEQFPSEIG